METKGKARALARSNLTRLTRAVEMRSINRAKPAGIPEGGRTKGEASAQHWGRAKAMSEKLLGGHEKFQGNFMCSRNI